jgi:hypothetical protein
MQATLNTNSVFHQPAFSAKATPIASEMRTAHAAPLPEHARAAKLVARRILVAALSAFIRIVLHK